MVAIPLGIGTFTRQPSNQPEVILKNMMVEKEISGAAEDQYARIQRPGLTKFNYDVAGPLVRGVCYVQGLFGSLPLKVVGTKLYKFNGNVSTELGTVVDDGKPVQFAGTNFGVAVLSANSLYFHDETTLTAVTIPDGHVPVSITSINSYVVIACKSGRWFWLVPGESIIDPLNFATAESIPDDLVAVMAIRGEVYFFGTSSMEVWQPTGDPDLILTRALGREWDKGLMTRDSLCRFDNTGMFLGSDGTVYGIDGTPTRISNVGIEERIRLRTGAPSALSYTMDGHTVYALFIPGQGTFVYDALTGEWAEYTTFGGTDGWVPRTACPFGSDVLLGDGQTGAVFKLDPLNNTDDGVVFERAVSGAVPFHAGRQRNDNISVHVGSDEPVTVRMRFRDGLRAWSAYRTAVTSTSTDIVHFWRLGAAKQPVRVVEFSCIEDKPFRVSGAWANEGRVN